MISIMDTTYREGKQSYFGNLLPDSMIDYAKLLEKIGIKYMEVGYPFTSDVCLREFRRLMSGNTDIQICVHSALNKDNFEKLIKEGVTKIDTSLKFKELTEEIINTQIIEVKKIIDDFSFVPKDNFQIRIGIENAFKIPEIFLVMLCKKIANIKNVTRISLSDTDGSANPKIVRVVLNTIDRILPKNIALELHLHNDCNLASANLYEAYDIFINQERELIVDATLGGIGERNGITSIGDIFSLFYLNDKNLLESNYSTKHYAELYKYVFKDQVFNRDPVNPLYFSHSSGLHIAKFLESGNYQSINPETFGYKPKLIFNDFTSGDSIRVLLKIRLNIEINKDMASKYALHIRNLSAEKKINFIEDEVLRILKDFFNKL